MRMDVPPAAVIFLPFDSIPSIQSTLTKPNCGDSSGMIYIIATGGTVPYHYLWNTGDTTQNLLNIPAGLYAVTVTDIHGCYSNSIIVLQDSLMVTTFDTVLQNTLCNLIMGKPSSLPEEGFHPIIFMDAWRTKHGNTHRNGSRHLYCATTDAHNCTVYDTLTIGPSLALVNSISKANANW
ncbi:hypothetical protein EMGBS15_12520 [Filimonas sp.]|nr:hypothetical protein EMGBS15_12520 [Filimonas sp.]